jgi:hypothetical protein
MQKQDSHAGSQLKGASQPQSPLASAAGSQPKLLDSLNQEDAEQSDDSEEEKKIYTYKCPVFRTTLRL